MKQRALWLVAVLAGSLITTGLAAPPSGKPAPKLMLLDAAGKDYLPLLQGPPETISMRSGLVVLAPGKAVGRHSTKGNEEMLVVLEGQGEMRFAEGDSLSFGKGTALYCPPNTEHDVFNTGAGTLRYVYVVSNATN